MEELRKILQLVASGRISAHEANSILSRLSGRKKNNNEPEKTLNIELSSENGCNSLFRIMIPLKLILSGLKLIPYDRNINIILGGRDFSLNAVDWNEIFKQAKNSGSGDVFDLEYLNDDGIQMRLHVFLE